MIPSVLFRSVKSHNMLKCLPLAVMLLPLAGCVSGEEFNTYSPRYSFAEVPGPGGRSSTQLMPDSCAWSASAQNAGMLPAGCSNAYNLQRMVESERDLVQGRQMGPAPATSATRAARHYLEGRITVPSPHDTPELVTPQIGR